MSSSTEEIASQWSEQMQRGYLKLATLFMLTKGPLHGYRMIELIKEWTLGAITPTAGGIYPTLRELEDMGLVRGAWIPEEKKKVYHITNRGRAVFRGAAERHFEFVRSIRDWFLRRLVELKIVKEVELPSAIEPAVAVLLLDEKASIEERIKALEKLKSQLRHQAILLNKMALHLTERIEELKYQENGRTNTEL